MIYFTAHTFKCVCHCRRAMFRVLGMYNFGLNLNRTATLVALRVVFDHVIYHNLETLKYYKWYK